MRFGVKRVSQAKMQAYHARKQRQAQALRRAPTFRVTTIDNTMFVANPTTVLPPFQTASLRIRGQGREVIL